jgi:hypothetical protein
MDDDNFLATGGGFITGFLTDFEAGFSFGGSLSGLTLGLNACVNDVFGPIPPQDQMGIWGTAPDAPGVVGTTGKSYGVYGQFGDPGGPAPPAGVCGTSRQGFGVVGSSSQLGGVLGQAGNFVGVWGFSNESVGVGGRSNGSYGLLGLSFAPPRGGNLADQPAGVYGQSVGGSHGVLGVADEGAAIVGVNIGEGQAGFFQGDVRVTRNLVVDGQIFAGIKDAMVPFPDGSKRVLHCMESPEHWFEDFGSARLTRGRVTVTLDAEFAKVVKLNDYRVFLTPEGDCQGLYVRSKRGTSFEVRELQGGTSNVAFSYRIVAKRKDIKAHRRFAKIDTTVPMPTGKARAARGRKAKRLPSSIRALLAATPLSVPTAKAHAARGSSKIRALLAAQKKRARQIPRKPAVPE